MTAPGSLEAGASGTRWQRSADRLARYGWAILAIAVALAIVGAVVYAVIWEPRPGGPRNVADDCPEPCFDMGGMPSLRDLAVIVPFFGYLLAVVLGLPGLLAGLWDGLRGRWVIGAGRLLVFVGPLLFFVGVELVPHLLSPCFLVPVVGGARLPELYCDGAELADRWHPLSHALLGALPLAALYWSALRRWRPDVAGPR